MCGIGRLLKVGHADYSLLWQVGEEPQSQRKLGGEDRKRRSSWLGRVGKKEGQYPVTSRLAEVMAADRHRQQIHKRKCYDQIKVVPSTF